MNIQFKQKGATLIVVLIMLVAITIIGTLAVRQSMVTLGVATNSQAQQLMMQNSDAAFFNIESGDNIAQGLMQSGMFKYISGALDKDKELVFCFRGSEENFYDSTLASLMVWEEGKTAPTNNTLGTDGYCSTSATSGNFFTSGRRAVMTQIAVKFTSTSENDPFFGKITGTDEDESKLETSKPMSVYAVSLMPTLSSDTNANIDECLNSRMNEVTIPDGTTVPANAVSRQNVTDCLTSRNIPFTSFEQHYLVSQDFKD
ncbi:hypothetical protein SAMN05421749_10463 [Acinetobacter marinus]|uniref:PilX N-terminal n=1 Tax=Acinetobacter marinus TaxID=281375 RepID=A0A1G6KHW8_9GAMM|nr:hypothetical protein SAMN05421749_10463 [Acinetobacter marinus]